MWIDLVLPKQRILEIYLNIAELGPSGQFGAEAGAIYAFGRSAIRPVAARSGALGGDPAQSGQAQRPQSRPRGAPSGRDLYGPGAGPGLAAMLERKSRFLSHLGGILNLALGHSILYKRGLIGISARAQSARPSAFGRCLRQHP